MFCRGLAASFVTHVLERREASRFLESAATDILAKRRFKTFNTVSPDATRAVRGVAGPESPREPANIKSAPFSGS
ncbi:MAG TPA: hypothetical protein VGP63_16950 [Planctomycetaceae bacterium]|nr:hypothetical protein [Planctomycetaceae bacterium]